MGITVLAKLTINQNFNVNPNSVRNIVSNYIRTNPIRTSCERNVHIRNSQLGLPTSSLVVGRSFQISESRNHVAQRNSL